MDSNLRREMKHFDGGKRLFESWPEIDELCKHLILLGLNATVDWKEQNLGASKLKLYLGLGEHPRTGVIGSVKMI